MLEYSYSVFVIELDMNNVEWGKNDTFQEISFSLILIWILKNFIESLEKNTNLDFINSLDYHFNQFGDIRYRT